MELFSKDKELVLKLVNAVLVIWFIAATVITFSIGLNLLVKEKELSQEEYVATYCITDDEDRKQSCEEQYRSDAVYREDSKRSQKINLFVGIFNILAVGTTLFALNRKKSKK